MVLYACIPQLSFYFLERNHIFLDGIYNSNILVEFIMLSLFFKSTYFTEQNQMKFWVLWWICCISGAVNIGVFGFNDKFLTGWLCINNLVYTAWILISLYELYEREDILIEQHYIIYLFGLFLYVSCTILFFGLRNVTWEGDKQLKGNLKILHSIFNTIMYISFFMGIVLEWKKTRSQHA